MFTLQSDTGGVMLGVVAAAAACCVAAARTAHVGCVWCRQPGHGLLLARQALALDEPQAVCCVMPWLLAAASCDKAEAEGPKSCAVL